MIVYIDTTDQLLALLSLLIKLQNQSTTKWKIKPNRLVLNVENEITSTEQ